MGEIGGKKAAEVRAGSRTDELQLELVALCTRATGLMLVDCMWHREGMRKAKKGV